MNTTTTTAKKWTFPEEIKIENVATYDRVLKKMTDDKNIIFDLSNTFDIHASFIGFYGAKTKVKKVFGEDLDLLDSTKIYQEGNNLHGKN